jgi:hypothetical protein
MLLGLRTSSCPEEPNGPATGKLMIGAQIGIDMKPATANQWKAKSSGSITLVNAATLNLQGRAVGGLICETQTRARTN